MDEPLSTDELLERMVNDERDDRIAEQTLAAPIDYAKSRGIRPQKVYYLLRTHRLKETHCPCGRKCIEIAEADRVLKELEDAKREVVIPSE